MYKIYAFGIIFTIFLTGCVDNDEADIKQLISAGYKNPKIIAHGSMDISCGSPTSPTGIFNREFEAEKNGKKMKGVICAGAFGETINEK
jgi:hypothetical protein